MIDIYYGPYENHPLRLLQPELQSLKASFSHSLSGYDALQSLMACPSMSKFFRNKFVVLSPVDISIKRGPEGVVVAYNESGINKEPLTQTVTKQRPHDPFAPASCETLQMLEDHYLTLVSDQPLEMEVTPPYLHSSPIFGIAGSFDIGRWARPISFSGIFLKDKGQTVSIKRGHPILYLNFKTEKKVRLNKCVLSDKAISLTGQCLNLKNVIVKQALEKQYEAARSNNILPLILREMKNSLCGGISLED